MVMRLAMGLLAAIVLRAEFANPPRLSYLAYISAYTTGNMTVDAQGNVYVVGLIAPGLGGCGLARVDAYGTVTCVALPPIGTVTAVASDASGFIYAVGTENYYVSGFNGATTLVKLSPDLSQTIYSIAIAGVRPWAMAVDGLGRAYITGAAGPTLQTTPGVLQTALGEGSTTGGFALRVGATGAIEYATYVGDNLFPTAIAIDDAGEAWIAADPDIEDTEAVLKLDAEGRNLLVSRTFGSTYFSTNPIALDRSGAVYIAGVTGPGLPTTPGAFQQRMPPNVSDVSGFVVKLSPAGDVVYSTYVNPAGAAVGSIVEAVAADADGNAYLAVWGAPSPADQPAYCGVEEETMMLVLSADGSTALTSAYLEASGGAIVIDGKGGVFMATYDGAVAKFDLMKTASGLVLSCAGNVAAAYPNYLGPLVPKVAPGEIVTLAGKGFNVATTVTFDGHAAPVLYADAGQINAVVPFEIGSGTIRLTLDNGTEVLNWPVVALPAEPAIFAGAIINEDGTRNTSTNPARAGSTISFFVSGAGMITPALADGETAPLEPPYSTPRLSLLALMEGGLGLVEAPVLEAIQAPGFVAGLVLARVRLPYIFGGVAELFVSAGTEVSPTVTVFSQ